MMPYIDGLHYPSGQPLNNRCERATHEIVFIIQAVTRSKIGTKGLHILIILIIQAVNRSEISAKGFYMKHPSGQPLRNQCESDAIDHPSGKPLRH